MNSSTGPTAMPRPTISIVTPSFNQGRFLEQTITSVLGQAGRGDVFDLEYFVVDGGSKDESVEIIRRFESQLKWWCSEPDQGQTDAINKGFKRATGSILAYINSDDYYLPSAFAAVVDAMRNDPAIGVLHGVCLYVSEDGRLVRKHRGNIQSLSESLDIWNVWRSRDGRRHFVQPEVFWRRELVEQIGLFDPGRHYTMDFDFWVRAFAAGVRFESIDQELAAFRLHSNQKTAQRDKTTNELLQIVSSHLKADDRRISRRDRSRIGALCELERRLIESRKMTANQRRGAFLHTAIHHPRLLQTPQFWRYLRKGDG